MFAFLFFVIVTLLVKAENGTKIINKNENFHMILFGSQKRKSVMIPEKGFCIIEPMFQNCHK